MALVTLRFSDQFMEMLCRDGTVVLSYRVLHGVSDRAKLLEAKVDALRHLRLVFGDPALEEDEEHEVIWEFVPR